MTSQPDSKQNRHVLRDLQEWLEAMVEDETGE